VSGNKANGVATHLINNTTAGALSFPSSKGAKSRTTMPAAVTHISPLWCLKQLTKVVLKSVKVLAFAGPRTFSLWQV
jgi:hypothetical protein